MESRNTANAKKFMEALPHCNAMNMQLESIGDGTAEISLPYDERLIGDPETGVLHGGAVSAVLDTCCGAAVMSHPDTNGVTATIDLRIEYMRSAKPGATLWTRAECFHLTRSVAFVRAESSDGQEGLPPVATATGTFMVGATRK